MPNIQMNFARSLDADTRKKIVAASGRLIEILPDKSEKLLMLQINDGCSMYFRGQEENCAFITIHHYLAAADAKKAEFGEALVKEVSALAGLDPVNIFMTFIEYGNWISAGIFK